MTEERLKIAVFVDFDNIEIGVKTTLNVAFDVGTILEAIKERGEVVTKIAYGDWTRAGDYSRLLTQHAIKMVQRNHAWRRQERRGYQPRARRPRDGADPRSHQRVRDRRRRQ